MIEAFFLSLGQLLDRRIARVFLKSLALTIALFLILGVALWHGVHWAANRWIGESASTYADLAVLLVLLAAHWLLFRAIAVAAIGVFADEVVSAVEAKHYPEAHARAVDVPLGRSIGMGLRSAGRILMFNLIASPAYIALLITGVGTPIAFFVVNSLLLGRDLGDMVAARHLPAKSLSGWRRGTSVRRFLLGMFGTAIFFIPVVNLIAPVIGAAMATHLFHRGKSA